MASSFERQAGGQRTTGFVNAPGQGREEEGEESQWQPGKTCWVGQFGVGVGIGTEVQHLKQEGFRGKEWWPDRKRLVS